MRCTDNTSQYTHAHFFSLRTSHVTARVAQGPTSSRRLICLRASKIIPSSVMSLLCVHSTPFPSHVLFTSQTTPAASPALLTGIRPNRCATSLGDGLPGRLVVPIPNTSYETKFCIDVDSEHTPINLPSRNMSFQQEYDATITVSDDLNLPRHSGASSSSQHPAASIVPTLSKPGACIRD